MKPPIYPQTAFVAFLLLFASYGAFSQPPSGSSPPASPDRATSPLPVKSSKDTTSLASLGSVNIRLIDPNPLPANRPENLFRHFEVIDERADTARIGLHSGFRVFHYRNRQLIFDRPAAEEVAGFLNTHFARPDAPYTALVVLRILWMSDANYVREDLMQDHDKRTERTHIRIKAELYAVNEDGYRPILRFDSAQVSKKDNYSQWGNDLAGMLDDLADSASLLTGRRAANSRSLRLEEIRQFNQTRFSAPISTDTALVRGVYASFEEFKANDPSIRDFELKKEKDQLLLYVKETGGNTYYSHNAWGFCDGKDIYIMKEGTLRHAWREGKAIYFLSPIDKYSETYYPSPGVIPGAHAPLPTGGLITLPGSTSAGAVMSSRVSGAGLRIFTVDMDTGDVY